MAGRGGRIRRIWAVAAAIAVVGIGAQPAGAATATVVGVPVPAAGYETELQSVSCIGVSDCWAVGVGAPPGGSEGPYVPVVGRRTAGGWVTSAVSLPDGVRSAQLAGVSCVDAVTCWAVGVADERTLVLRWNGSAWSRVATPNPTGASWVDLRGVSCPTASYCTAVGRYDSAGLSRSLAMRWNGSAWAIVASPRPTGATESNLAGVSCVSAVNCKAVGWSVASGRNRALVLRWNGSSWAVVASPVPVGVTESLLTSVSCVTGSDCKAAGVAEAAAGPRPFVIRWNGRDWAVMGVPGQQGNAGSYLIGISCPTTTSCRAVGAVEGESGNRTLVWRWNGSGWAIPASPNPTGAVSSELFSVDCVSAAVCVAVGKAHLKSGRQALVERWDGVSWTLVSFPATSGPVSSEMEAVACVSATVCWAVGSATGERGSFSTSWRWDGSVWSVVPMPPVGTASFATPRGISCPAPGVCWAVGETSGSAGERSLVMRWNGSAWSVVTVPTPSGAIGSALMSVTCVTATACWAVGRREGTFGIRPLVMRWNGSTWSVVAVPTPGGQIWSELADVACVSMTACWAVGGSETATGVGASVMRWNGTAWSAVTVPSPAGARLTALTGVACPAAGSCWAVGRAEVAGSERSLVMRWNGSAWSVVASPNPTGSYSTALDGVECTTARCWAVGSSFGSGTARPVVMTGGISGWSLVPTPLPAPAYEAGLTGVGCTGVGPCWAVGRAQSAMSRPYAVRLDP